MITYSSLAVVIVYAASMLLISYWVSRKKQARDDFSTGGRQFGWLTSGISILATYISSMTFIGMPGWVYQRGMEPLVIHLNYPLVIFLSVLFFIPVYYKLGITSIYEYLEFRFGVVSRTINSFIFIFVQAISSGIILYAVSLILVRIFPLSVKEAIIYISLFTACYTYFGGISTIIWTDVLQSLFLLVGCVTVFVSVLMQLPDLNTSSLFFDKLRVVNLDVDFYHDTTLWAGVLAASFLHLSVCGTNQLIIQRTLATRSLKTAQKSMLICGYGAFFIYLLFSLLGVFLYIFYQGKTFENSNEVILDFVFNHTHPVVVGLVISALLAAAMSTLDSVYNSMATVITYDFYKRFVNKDADSVFYEKFARQLCLCCAICVIIPALFAISNESVLKSVATLASVFVGVRLGYFVLGLFFDKTNEGGAIIASIFSLFSVGVAQYLKIAWPWFAVIGTSVFVCVGVIASYFTKGVSPQQVEFIEHQKQFYSKPTLVHYSLLVFMLLTIVFVLYLPELFMLFF